MISPWFSIAIPFAAVTLVAAVGAVRSSRERRKLRALHHDGVTAIRALRQLLEDIQTHRGLVSMQRNGADGMERRIHERQAGIERTLREVDSHTPAAILPTGRWQRTKQYWARIAQDLPDLSAAESFDRHGALIRQLLFLIQDVADQARLTELPSDATSTNQDSILTLATTLPEMAEGIGQARAIGAGVAAAAHCSSVARIRLRFLRHQVADAIDQLSTGDAQSQQHVADAVRKLVAEIDAKLLAPTRPEISAEHYFQIASDALKAIYVEFDSRGAALMQRLTARAPKERSVPTQTSAQQRSRFA